MNVNCRSLISTEKKLKLEQLIETHKPDIILASETHLNNEIENNEIFSDFFLNPPPCRKDRRLGEGGVLIAVRSDIISVETEADAGCEIIWTKVTLTQGQVLVGCFYRQPTNDMVALEQLRVSLSKLYTKGPITPNIIMGGDFNLPDILWDTLEIKKNPQYTKTLNEKMIDIMQEYNLTQIVHEPTRGSNTLDLFLTTNPDLAEPPSVHPGMSDHDVVICNFRLKAKQQRKAPRVVYQVGRGDVDAVRKELLDGYNNYKDNVEQYDVNTSWNIFKEIFFHIVNTHIPQKTITGKQRLPWITSKIKRLIRQKQRRYNAAKAHNNHKDWQRYREVRKQVHEELKREHKNYIRQLLETDTNTDQDTQNTRITKKFWAYVRAKRKDISGIQMLQREDGSEATEASEKAEILNNQYEKVFTEENPVMPSLPKNPIPTIPRINITINGVTKQLRALNPNKAPGPDCLPTRIMKETAFELAPYLCTIFQKSLDTGKVPEDWKRANITPIYKKGKRDQAANYRPVSLTSVTCKILEHIIHHTVMNHLEEHRIMVHYQHGFRKAHSCETQLLTTLDSIAKAIDDKKQVDLLVLDFSKAFDTVPHQRLLGKLHHYGIRNQPTTEDSQPTHQQDQRLHDWFKNWLCGRSQQVILEGKTSKHCLVTSGVPQGTVLGPLCFLVYINDIGNDISSKTSLKLFADDSLLFREISGSDDSGQLQKDLDTLVNWAETWQMSFHPSKCYTISIGLKKNAHHHSYTMLNETLEHTDSITYLGIKINKHLNWDDHINHITSKASKSLGYITRNLQQCPPEVKSQAYMTLVRPILEYACAAWDPHCQKHIDKLEKVQRKAARFALNCQSRTPGSVSQAVENLEWLPLATRRKNKRLRILYKTISGLNDTITIPAHISLKRNMETIRTRNSHTQKFIQPRTRTDIYKNSFFPRTVTQWNSLPNSIINSLNLESFSSRLLNV